MPVQPRGHIRRVFAGANSAYGFWSLFEAQLELAPQRVFVIKGGPGTGKSVFMRRIAEDLAANGFDLDLLQCASDAASVDGFVVPALGLAMVDGTALRARRETILKTADANRACYRHAYHYLAAARIFADDARRHVDRCGARDAAALHALAEELVHEVLGSAPPRRRPGRVRPLFASAITPGGCRHGMDTIFAPLSRRYVLCGPRGTGKGTIVRRLREEAVRRGYDVETFHCGLDPHREEHLVIPELGVGVTTGEPPHTSCEPRGGDVVLDTTEAVDAGSLARALDDLNTAQDLSERSLELAVGWLARAKTLHDELEQFYAPHTDFAAIDDLRGEVLAQIYGAAHEQGLLPGTDA